MPVDIDELAFASATGELCEERANTTFAGKGDRSPLIVDENALQLEADAFSGGVFVAVFEHGNQSLEVLAKGPGERRDMAAGFMGHAVLLSRVARVYRTPIASRGITALARSLEDCSARGSYTTRMLKVGLRNGVQQKTSSPKEGGRRCRTIEGIGRCAALCTADEWKSAAPT